MEETYQNPVYSHECADPFVMKFRGEYWCYRTGLWDDGRVFGILHSTDLVHWQPVGGAMQPLAEPTSHYWAPEVMQDNGTFYLYYSAGDEEHMHLRVATATDPAGPFIDSGRKLTRQKFAIDAHVFEDEDGLRYMFYATDFLEYERVGTGTVMDRLLDPFTLAGEPRPVSRARFDWQIYDPHREEKGGVRWHTLEGSFVLKRKGQYYQMFSGGNYQNPSYGVGVAVTTDLRQEGEWQQVVDGRTRLPVLRTLPGRVNGPGHNSVVMGPDNRQLFCVYHVIAQQEKFERVLAIDRLDWSGERLVVLGPSSTPQPLPISASGLRQPVRVNGGRWAFNRAAVTQVDAGVPASARFPLDTPNFVFESGLRQLESLESGQCGFCLYDKSGEIFRAAVLSLSPEIELTWKTRDGMSGHHTVHLPIGFKLQAEHHVRLETNGQMVNFSLDHAACRWSARIGAASRLGLLADGLPVEFSMPEITYGFEDLFEDDTVRLEDLDWTCTPAQAWVLRAGVLAGNHPAGKSARLLKRQSYENYELVINLRALSGGSYVISPAWKPSGENPGLRLVPGGAGWMLHTGEEGLQLPAEFNPAEFQQFRFRKQGSKMRVYWLDRLLGDVKVPTGETQVSLSAEGSGVELDMVRLTEIREK